MHDAGSNPQGTLDYAPRPPRRRKIIRRTVLAMCLIGTTLATWRWGPGAWKLASRQAQLLQWQRLLENHSVPAGTVVFETDPVAAAKLLSTPGYASPHRLSLPMSGFGTRPDGTMDGKPISETIPEAAALRPTGLDEFLAISGLPLDRTHIHRSPFLSNFGPPFHPSRNAVAFMGILRSPSGQRRLVIVECFQAGLRSNYVWLPSNFFFHGAVLQPAGVLAQPAVISPSNLASLLDPPPVPLTLGIVPKPEPNVIRRVFMGHVDPTDPSHFIIPYESSAGRFNREGRITDGGWIEWRAADGSWYR